MNKIKTGRKLFDGKRCSLILQKLEQAFAIGCTDEEACCHTGISTSALYDFQTKNPEFLKRKRLLKMTPVLKARMTVMHHLDDPKIAFKFLERKRRDEFGANPSLSSDSDQPAITQTRIIISVKKCGISASSLHF